MLPLLLLCTVLLWATARAQSGDVDVDAGESGDVTGGQALTPERVFV